MNALFEYLDYRQLLKDFYEEQKKTKPFFSYRFISGRVKLNPGYLVKLFQGKIQLGRKNIPAFADLMNLQGKERDYFTELVHFGRAKHQDEIERRFERLQSIKGIRFRTVADNTVEFYQQWYHMAIRSLISIHPFDGKNFKKLSSMLTPPITAKQARESIRLLEKLKLIARREDGIYMVTDQFISTGEKWTSAAIQNYQKKNMELGIASLENHDKKLRDISTVTMPLSLRDMDALRERIRLFRQELLLISKEGTAEDSVFQLNVQLFPVAFCSGGKE
jgi:uncharacterized protein (TIGR02147 family)